MLIHNLRVLIGTRTVALPLGLIRYAVVLHEVLEGVRELRLLVRL